MCLYSFIRHAWPLVVFSLVSVMLLPVIAIAAIPQDSIQLANGSVAGLLYCDNGSLYTGLNGNADYGLCKYSYTNTLLWSTSLGADDFEFQLCPTVMQASLDHDQLYVATTMPNKLFRISATTGVIEESVDLVSKPRYIVPITLCATEFICVVTNSHLLVFDNADISIPVYQMILVNGHVGDVVFDDLSDRLFITFTDVNVLARYSIVYNQGVISTVLDSITTDDCPYSCFLYGSNLIVVCNSVSATVQLISRDTLQVQQNYEGLYNLIDSGLNGEYLLLISRCRQSESNPFNCAMASLNLTNGVIYTTSLDNTFPSRVVSVNQSGISLVVNAGYAATDYTSWNPGALWTIDVSNLDITDSDVLSGGSVSGCFNPTTNLLYTGDAANFQIDVYLIQ